MTKEIPPHLQNSWMERAPQEFINFCLKYGVEDIYFVDDSVKCKNSIRLEKVIYVNTRGTYWANMIYPPMWCRDVYEAVVLRFLHEIGHIYSGHYGDPSLIFSPHGLFIPRHQDFFGETLGGNEGEAWEFALSIRKKQSKEFSNLYLAFKSWYSNHEFKDKDWDEDSESQWRRIHNRELSQESFRNIPNWVFEKFGKYKPNEV